MDNLDLKPKKLKKRKKVCGKAVQLNNFSFRNSR